MLDWNSNMEVQDGSNRIFKLHSVMNAIRQRLHVKSIGVFCEQPYKLGFFLEFRDFHRLVEY